LESYPSLDKYIDQIIPKKIPSGLSNGKNLLELVFKYLKLSLDS